MNMSLFASQSMEMKNGLLILASLYANLIIIVDPTEEKKTFIYQLKNESVENDLYLSFFCDGDELALIPYNASDLLIYDLKEEKERIVDFGLDSEEKRKKGKFLRAVKTEDYVWIIGENIKKIILMELTHNYRSIVKCVYYEEPDLLWSSNYLRYKNNIYIPSRNKNKLLEIDTNTTKIRMVTLFSINELNGFSDIFLENGLIKLFDYEGKSYYYPLSSGETKVFLQPCEEETLLSCKSVSYFNKLYRMSFESDDIFVKDGDGNYRKLLFESCQNGLDKKRVHFLGSCQSGEILYFQLRNGKLFRLNMKEERIDPIIIPEEKSLKLEKKEIIHKIYQKSIIEEGLFGNLEDYLVDILEEDFGGRDGSQNNVGKKIYKNLTK